MHNLNVFPEMSFWFVKHAFQALFFFFLDISPTHLKTSRFFPKEQIRLLKIYSGRPAVQEFLLYLTVSVRRIVVH